MASASTPLRATSPDGQLELAAERARITLLPGTQQQLALSMRNNAGSPLSIELSTKGLPGNWISLNPSTLRLASVQGAAVALTLGPPSEAPPGDYPLVVLAQASDHPETAVRLSLILEIAEPGKLTVAVVPSQADGQASAEFQVQLAQTGVETVALSLSAKDEENACEYAFDPVNLVLQANGSATSRLVVRARQGLAGLDSRTYAFTVTATATQGASVMGSAPGRFVQRRALPIRLSLVPTEQRGPDRVSYSVRLANDSQVQTVVRLSASDPDAACRFQFDPASLTLPPSGQAQATLSVVPLQHHSGTGEKIYPFTVRAEPSGELLSPVQVEGRLIQTAAAQPLLTLRPTSQTKSGAATYTLQVKNPRAEPLVVDLRASDVNGACTFTLTPPRLQIPPNGMATAQLSVRPNGALLPGEAHRTYPFSAEARAADLPEPAVVEGALTLVRPSRLLLFLVVGGIILALVLCIAAALALRGIFATSSVHPTQTPLAVLPTHVPPTSTHIAQVIVPTVAPPPVDTVVPVPPTDTPTEAPIPLITPLPTFTEVTITLLPTRTRPPPPPPPPPSPTPELAPGVYVTNLRVDPTQPKSGQDMTFYATFQNSTGVEHGYRWCVEIWRPDIPLHSFGITPCKQQSVPPGANELQSAPGYRVSGLGSCLPLRARVIWEDANKNRTPFLQPDGSTFWLDFQVCP